MFLVADGIRIFLTTDYGLLNLITKGNKMNNIEKPKCPNCRTNEFVRIDKTATKICTDVGVVAGGIAGYRGAVAGAEAGAIINSFVPVIGTAIGAAAGGVIGFLT